MKFDQYIETLVACCIDVFQKMAKMEISHYEIKQGQIIPDKYAIAIAVSYKDINDELEGSFILGLIDETMAIRLASSIGENMGLAPVDKLDEDATDILSEFMNTVAGEAITALDQMGLSAEFSTPFTIQENALDEGANLRSENYSIYFKIGDDEVVVSISFREIFKSILKGKKILVVDDSKLIRNALAKALEKDGCQVAQAGDGLEGVRVFKSFRPDLTVLDLVMPKLGGLEALARMRQTNPTAKIIMLTSSSKKDDVIKAARLNILKYIKKPINVESFLDLVRTIFDENS
ncbi:MAG: response regulator [Deltaproteobacteria bacterium]|nr:response regulator [Deltaproteobacteria bacterium]